MTTYRVMIVEDEDIIRAGIRKLIGEMDLPIGGVTEACSGSDALELARRETVDIVVTDIRMDDGDGLTLIRNLAQAGIRVKSIILSGYGQFAYAQQAITLGVGEYLLKPIKRQALRDALGKLIAQLEAEGAASARGQPPQPRDAGVRHRYVLAVSVYAASGRVAEAMRAWPERTLTDGGRDAHVYAYAAPPPEGGYPALLVGTDDAEVADGRRLHAMVAEALQADDAGVGAIIGVSERMEQPVTADRLPRLYEQSAEALDYRLLRADCRHFYYADVASPTPPPAAAPNLFAQSIRSALQDGDLHALSAAVGDWFRYVLQQRDAAPGPIVESLHHLLAYAAFVYGREGATAPRGIGELTGMLRAAATADEFRTRVLARFAVALEGAAGRAAPYDSNAISFIIQYLDRHYDQNITLRSAADQIFMNPSYFSTLFKKKTGINFVHYLQKLRIEKSKALLANPQLKIYEVAARTGFADEKYFFKVFKSVTGITPNEYRDRRLQ